MRTVSMMQGGTTCDGMDGCRCASYVHERHLLSAIAVAVQRGNALAMLNGYSGAARLAGPGQGEAAQ